MFRIKIYYIVVFLVFGFLLATAKADAQSCNGYFSVGTLQTVCTPAFCDPNIDPGCTCNSACTDTGILKGCSTFNSISCTACKGGMGECCDPSFAQCSWDSGICGGGPVSYCNGGTSSFYCCGSGMYCNPPNPSNTNFTCSSTPPGPCDAFGGQAGCTAWCRSTLPYPSGGNAGASSYCDSTCGGCLGGGTPTPTTGSGSTACPNNPPNPPGGTNACINGASCPGGSNIYGSPTNNDCGAGRVCCNTPAATPTSPPGCSGYGAACGVGCCSPYVCSAGICNIAATPTSPPGCSGYGAACGVGCCSPYVCSGGICNIAPTPTSPPGCSGYGAACGVGCCAPYVCSAGICNIAATPTSPPGAVSCSWSPPSGVAPGGTSNLTVTNPPAGGFSYSFNPVSGYSILSSTPTTANVRFTTPGTTWTFSVISLITGATLTTCNVSTTASATPTPTPISTVTVQGRFVDASGNNLTSNIGQSVTINSSPPNFQNTNTFWSNALPTGTYTVTASVPSGYIVTSSSCTNCVTHTTYEATNPAVVTLPLNGNYADIYFKYAPNVCTATFSGSLIVDPDTVNCAALGGSLFTDFGQVSAYNGSAPPRQQVVVSGGTYTNLTYGPTCGTGSFITLSAVPYTVTGICDNGVYVPQTGYSYPYTSTPDATRTISFLLSSQGPWFQVGTGDVRFPSLTNKIPRGLSASVTGSSLFASSTGNVTLGAGVLDPAINWQVNQEYSYNNDFQNGLGSMSYTFYLSRAKQRSIVINPVTSPVNLSSLASGVYQTNGNLTITGNVTGGKHIVLLVGGTASVNSSISVPAGAGNLFVLAAKEGITIDKSVGVVPTDAATMSLQGYYTSEGNISINGTNDCSIESDLRLNIGGALVANSLHPFAEAGLGKIIVNRNICSSNLTHPTYYVSPRPDFLLQMTDFYKIPYKTYKEVNP